MLHDQLELLAWSKKQDCQIKPFPSDRRIGRIRDVAEKHFAKPTIKAKRAYVCQVDKTMRAQFNSLGLPEPEIEYQMACFWFAVRQELNRIEGIEI